MYNLEVTAYWKLLTQNDLPVPEPENVDASFYPSTKHDIDTPKGKYGFKETFTRPESTSKDTNMI
eukprot:10670319-Ditylum_brightwellii.AAC.1